MVRAAVLRRSERWGIGSGDRVPDPKGSVRSLNTSAIHSTDVLSIMSWQAVAANLSIDFCLETPRAIQSLIKSEEFGFQDI